MPSQTGSAMPITWSPSKTIPPPSSFQRRQSSAYITSNRMSLQTMPPPGLVPMMTPYGIMPMTSPAVLTRQSMIMSPSLYVSPQSYNTPPPTAPLLYLSSSHIPSSARRSKVGAEM